MRPRIIAAILLFTGLAYGGTGWSDDSATNNVITADGGVTEVLCAAVVEQPTDVLCDLICLGLIFGIDGARGNF